MDGYSGYRAEMIFHDDMVGNDNLRGDVTPEDAIERPTCERHYFEILDRKHIVGDGSLIMVGFQITRQYPGARSEHRVPIYREMSYA